MGGGIQVGEGWWVHVAEECSGGVRGEQRGQTLVGLKGSKGGKH